MSRRPLTLLALLASALALSGCGAADWGAHARPGAGRAQKDARKVEEKVRAQDSESTSHKPSGADARDRQSTVAA
jgi:hypothetical protein